MRKIWRPAAWPDASGDPKRLRILVLTNLYPPHYIGGYELVCLDVVNHLRRQGHAVTVLTSSFGLTSPALDGEIHRTLTFQTPLALSRGDLIRREWQARQAFRRAIARSAPDVIYHFCLFGIPKSLLYAAQRIGVPVVYDFSAEWLYPDCGDDLWFRFWGSPAGRPHRQVAKAVLRRFLDPWFPTGRETLDLSRSYFTSERIKEIFLRAGFPVADAAVIYRGVDTRRFQPAPERIPPGPLPLLFAGRITKDKGLHTVIEALGILTKTGLAGSVSLTVAGPEQDATYANEVRRTIRSLCLEDQIRFVGLVPWDRMPNLYQEHAVYLLPSVFEEPFSIGLLEAMACGLAVLGTTTGGSREVLVEGENSLTFPAEDAQALAGQLRRVLDPALRKRIAERGRRTVESRFPLDRIHDQLETFLRDAVAQHRLERTG